MILASLNLFQVLALSAVAVALLVTWAGVLRGRVRPREGALWSLLLIAAAIAIHSPTVTSRIAQAVGIGRGTDLLVYITVILLLTGFWMMYTRLRRLRQDLTRVVRHLAILSAEQQLPREASHHDETISESPESNDFTAPPQDR